MAMAHSNLCLSVLKYSHAKGVRADNSIPWTHLQAPDIFAVVVGKGQRFTDQQLTLRVVQGSNVLESVDVGSYIDASIETRRVAREQGVTPQVEQLPIFGITKDSLLALRYRPSDGLARRMQLRLENSQSCRQLVDVFVRRGMEFQAHRPGTARSTATCLSTAPLQERMLTTGANSSSPYFTARHAASIMPSDPPANSTIELGSMPRLPSLQADRSFDPQPMQQSVVLMRDEAAAPREVAPDWLSNSALYRYGTTPTQRVLPEAFSLRQVALQPASERSLSTRNTTALPTIREVVEADGMPTETAVNMAPPLSSARRLNEQWSSSILDATALAVKSSDSLDARSHIGQQSTETATNQPYIHDHEIPPQREVPSNFSESRHSGGSRPSSSALTLPPLPKPKVINSSSSPSGRSLAQPPVESLTKSRPSTGAQLKRSLDNAFGEDTRPATTHGAGPIGAQTSESATGEEPPQKTPRTNDVSGSRMPLANRSVNTTLALADSLANAANGGISSSPLQRRKMSTNPPNTTAPNTIHHDGSLEEYATLSRQDRQALLEDFMMANLENPAFTKLCEDVENCWRRIALGL